ncbi:hypothetical protein KVR01_007945 [Diaporthe batatas]|uniref:uncharacterized protein n=1 Tax=Diaporthe batatas TaxID=748121 RepID=UPI001D05474D|nr:uncharacterized protein KVR01_007945 [Diaporthe batatas]KAG8162180.1 hypothetical protein KVR01_007945 [Diaporthe batatas]
MTVNQVADRFGRVPIGARQYVRIVNVYGAKSCSAWSNAVDLSFFGDCSGAESVFLHENSHNLDYWVAGGGSWYSQSQDWKDTVAKGSCVADNYAKTTYTEAFAQVGVMDFYNANVGSIWNWNVGCMADQVGRTIELLGDSVAYSSSRTCSRVWRHSTPICMGPAAADSGYCPSRKTPPAPTDPSISVAEGEPVMDEIVKTMKREAEVSAGILKKRQFSA